MNTPSRKAIQRYIAKMPPAVSGQSGHAATFRVAAVLINDFGLSKDDALPFIREYNTRCKPPWNEKELLHKLSSVKQNQ